MYGGKKNKKGWIGWVVVGGQVVKNKVFSSPENSVLAECGMKETLGI